MPRKRPASKLFSRNSKPKRAAPITSVSKPSSKAVKKARPKLRSGLERKVRENLESRGVAFEYEATRFKYIMPAKATTYTPDFRLPNGTYCEAKGKMDLGWRTRFLEFVKQHPEITVRILFQRNQKLKKGAKMTYGQWATKNSVEWAVSPAGIIPQEWLT